MNDTTFATRLKALRTTRHLSQQDLADAAGLHRITIAQLESGKRSDPAWSTIQALACALSCSTEDLRADGMG